VKYLEIRPRDVAGDSQLALLVNPQGRLAT
jgi:hypothetical protein